MKTSELGHIDSIFLTVQDTKNEQNGSNLVTVSGRKITSLQNGCEPFTYVNPTWLPMKVRYVEVDEVKEVEIHYEVIYPFWLKDKVEVQVAPQNTHPHTRIERF